jgi:hypothetical protein
MAEKTLPEVRAGQVWADNDPRATGRHVRVVALVTDYAPAGRTPDGHVYVVVELVGERGRPWSGLKPGEPQRAEPGRQTKIRLDRFKPTSTGYRLVQDVEG